MSVQPEGRADGTPLMAPEVTPERLVVFKSAPARFAPVRSALEKSAWANLPDTFFAPFGHECDATLTEDSVPSLLQAKYLDWVALAALDESVADPNPSSVTTASAVAFSIFSFITSSSPT